MKIIVYSWKAFLHRRYRHILFVILLITGSFLSILCARNSQPALSLMRGCIYASVSIVRLVFAVLLPFFAVILAVLYSKHSVLVLICFMKVFCFSFCLMGLRLSCGCAGWLVCGLLMFSDAVSVLLLLRLSLRHINGFLPSIGADLFKSISIAVGVSVFDCLYIAPFLARITNN